MAKIVPVILCGGSGTRLWPLSRSYLPKQFLPLVSERTLLQETVLRLQGLEGLDPPIAISNEEHRFLAAEQLRSIGRVPQALLLEPEGRNTAPAVAAAAMLAPDSVLLVLPADHLIGDLPRLHDAVRRAAALADQGGLVVFGIPPVAPETGFGYIKRGADLGDDAFIVDRFVEKPDAARAQAFLSEGGYFWNSGMFVFRAERYLEELQRQRPQIVSSVRLAISAARRDLDFVRLDAQSFLSSASESVDYAIMENAYNTCVVRARFNWSDVGSFSALWEAGTKDADGNVKRGDVIAAATRNSYLHSEGRLVAAIGVDDLVVVETADAVLVAERGRTQEIKQLVERLRVARRPEYLMHRRVYRPWGYYESVDAGTGYQVKRLMIKPGAKISLQRHRRRAEHWVVVSGHARVTHEDRTLDLAPNQSTYIPLGARHRLENAGTGALYVIEVQSGDYLGEDDIERIADDYRRD